MSLVRIVQLTEIVVRRIKLMIVPPEQHEEQHRPPLPRICFQDFIRVYAFSEAFPSYVPSERNGVCVSTCGRFSTIDIRTDSYDAG